MMNYRKLFITLWIGIFGPNGFQKVTQYCQMVPEGSEKGLQKAMQCATCQAWGISCAQLMKEGVQVCIAGVIFGPNGSQKLAKYCQMVPEGFEKELQKAMRCAQHNRPSFQGIHIGRSIANSSRMLSGKAMPGQSRDDDFKIRESAIKPYILWGLFIVGLCISSGLRSGRLQHFVQNRCDEWGISLHPTLATGKAGEWHATIFFRCREENL